MKIRLLIVWFFLSVKVFGQSPYFELIKVNILSAKNSYKLNGNVKYVKNLKHTFDTEMFFSKYGYLTKTIHYKSLENTRDTMYCVFDTLQDKSIKYNYIYQKDTILTLKWAKDSLPIYLKSTQTLDSIIYEKQKKTNKLVENRYSKFFKHKVVNIYNPKLELISTSNIDSAKNISIKNLIFVNIKNTDSLFKIYPKTFIEIFNYDTVGSIIIENYFSTNEDENYTSKFFYTNSVLDSVIYFKKKYTLINKYNSNFKIINKKEIDLITSKVIDIELYNYDSLNRIVIEKYNNGYFYFNKFYTYFNEGYCFEVIDKESYTEMFFDENGNLFKANKEQFVDKGEVGCCDEIESKYEFSFIKSNKGTQNIKISYDQNQNWTKVEVFENDKLVQVNSSEIEYY